MQFHRAMNPAQSRADAARALVVRELLRREVERLGLDGEVQLVGSEPVEEARIRLLLEREVENRVPGKDDRSEEHTSELQSLMRISYAVFCLKKKNKPNTKH